MIAYQAYKKKLHDLMKNACSAESSPEKLARSFCTGIFIAFFPLPGTHTLLMLASQWLFKLNFPILFFSTSLNNPWTMIPFFTGEYMFGHWLVHTVLGLNPGWDIPLAKIFGSGNICLWSFFIGGNLLGIAATLLSYPIMLKIFKKFLSSGSPQTLSQEIPYK